MKKGFAAYLEERDSRDFDFEMIVESKSLKDLADEYGVTPQAVHKTIRSAIDKIFYGIKGANPEMSSGEIFITMCMALKPEDPRELFKNLGLKVRNEIQDEAREMGIKV